MSNGGPRAVVLAGPNGAGKTSVSSLLLYEQLGITEFVNADEIAKGISRFSADAAALAAGRIMLARLDELADARQSFAFETTLASRSFAPWLARLRESGYSTRIFYVWVRSPRTSIRRVHQRIRAGGHSVPDGVIRRRYYRGLRNLFNLYMPVADRWFVFDNSQPSGPALVASGAIGYDPLVFDEPMWQRIEGARRYGEQDA